MEVDWHEAVMALAVLVSFVGGLFHWKGAKKVAKVLREVGEPKKPELEPNPYKPDGEDTLRE